MFATAATNYIARSLENYGVSLKPIFINPPRVLCTVYTLTSMLNTFSAL